MKIFLLTVLVFFASLTYGQTSLGDRKYEIEEILTSKPESATAYNDRGLARAYTSNHLEAIIDYTKAIQLIKNFHDAYFNRGVSKMELEDYRGAIADFTKAIEFQAENAQNYSKRGSCQLLLNKKEDACLDFSKAGELGLAEAYDLIKKNCK